MNLGNTGLKFDDADVRDVGVLLDFRQQLLRRDAVEVEHGQRPAAGGIATATIGWKAPRVRTAYTLTAATTLVSTTLVDANPGNNTGSTTIRVV